MFSLRKKQKNVWEPGVLVADVLDDTHDSDTRTSREDLLLTAHAERVNGYHQSAQDIMDMVRAVDVADAAIRRAMNQANRNK